MKRTRLIGVITLLLIQVTTLTAIRLPDRHADESLIQVTTTSTSTSTAVEGVDLLLAMQAVSQLTPNQIAALHEQSDIDAIYAVFHVQPPIVPDYATPPGPDVEDQQPQQEQQQPQLGNLNLQRKRPAAQENHSDSPAFKKEKRAFIEATNGVELSIGVETSVYPASPLSVAAVLPPGSIRASAARQAIRGGTSDLASGLLSLYQRDGFGRVIRAKFNVAGGSRSNPGQLADEWCNVAWNPTRTNGLFFNEGEAHSRNHQEYNAGHIIAAALGGSNTDPLNFFPHHSRSNTWGRYYRAELIAKAVKVYLQSRGSTAAVSVNIVLNYLNPAYPFVPSDGTYTISISRAAWNLHFNAATAAVAPNAASWASIFQARSVNVAGTNRRELVVNWRNLQGDLPIAAPPNTVAGAAGASAINGNEYVVDASTF